MGNRSHVIFSVSVVVTRWVGASRVASAAKMNLIDLAGAFVIFGALLDSITPLPPPNARRFRARLKDWRRRSAARRGETN